MEILFKWNGKWQTVKNHFSNSQAQRIFGKPVTSKRNLGLWKNGHFINCNVGDYIIKNSKGNYEVLDHEKAKSSKQRRH